MMSSSESSRCSLPATSALVIAVSTIRSVEERTSSRDLIAVVRSARRRSFRALMGPIVAALPRALARVPAPLPRPDAGRGPGRGPGARVVRRLGGAAVHAARGHRADPACGQAGAAGAAPQRHPHGARPDAPSRQWLRSLADLAPDLVIDTGDNLSHLRSVPIVLDSLGPLLDLPGISVFGSNDYFSPGWRNPLLYLLPDNGKRNTHTPQLPWRDLEQRFADRGWLHLRNERGSHHGRRHDLRTRRRRRSAPRLRRPRSRRRARRSGRRRAAGDHARAVPPGP